MEVLLEFEIPVCGYKYFEAGTFGLLQQLSILQPVPTLLMDRADFVPS